MSQLAGRHAAPQHAYCGGRRSLLLATAGAAAAVLPPPRLARAAAPNTTTATLLVDATVPAAYTTIGAALDAAPPGATVLVAPGTYKERLLPRRSVDIFAADAAAARPLIVWETSTPYEPVLELAEATTPVVVRVRVRGLSLRHASKSVANNYAVFAAGGQLELDGCDVASSTGTGVGVEGGAALAMTRCAVRGCARHGVAAFGGADGGRGGGGAVSVTDCVLSGNKLSGLLARAGAAPTVTGCTLEGNGEYALLLVDCGGAYSGNRAAGNRAGAVGLDQGSDVDAPEPAALQADNALSGPVVLLLAGR